MLRGKNWARCRRFKKRNVNDNLQREIWAPESGKLAFESLLCCSVMLWGYFDYNCCITHYPKTCCKATIISFCSRFCGSVFQEALSWAVSHVVTARCRVGLQSSEILTRLSQMWDQAGLLTWMAVDAGCWLGAQPCSGDVPAWQPLDCQNSYMVVFCQR